MLQLGIIRVLPTSIRGRAIDVAADEFQRLGLENSDDLSFAVMMDSDAANVGTGLASIVLQSLPPFIA